MKKGKNYFKPKVIQKKMKVNLLTSHRRLGDGLNVLEDGVLIANDACSPCCSCCGANTP